MTGLVLGVPQIIVLVWLVVINLIAVVIILSKVNPVGKTGSVAATLILAVIPIVVYVWGGAFSSWNLPQVLFGLVIVFRTVDYVDDCHGEEARIGTVSSILKGFIIEIGFLTWTGFFGPVRLS